MTTITLEMQEIWQHTKHKIHKSKKLYSRKNKHKKKDE